MKNRAIRPAAVLGAMLCAFLPAKSQPSELSNWRIEVEGPSHPEAQALSADLYDMHQQKIASADLSADGAFVFRGVALGQYWLTVTDAGGTPVFKDLLTASSADPVNTIRLPEKERQSPPSGPVSLTELQHPPAPKAVHLVIAAERYTHSGDYAKAAEQLEAAIRISPDYPAAHSNLAAQYARLGRYKEAAAQSRRAMELGTPNSVDLCNLAYAQALLHRFDDAIDSARRCLALAPASPQAHYLVGNLLARDRRTLPEALQHLELAAKALPKAQPQLEAVRRELNAH